MHIDKSVSFIDFLIAKTKNNAISWNPLKRDEGKELFPKLCCSHSHYCEINNAIIAVGELLPQYIESTDVGLFTYISGSRTYSILESTDLADDQDFDRLCSKTFRLYELVNIPDGALEKFIDNLIAK